MSTRYTTMFRPLLLVTALFSASTFANDVGVVDKPIAKGLYEMAYNQPQSSLYVASAGNRGDAGGAIYQLDSQTLAVKNTIKETFKPFGVVLNADKQILFTGNTRDGAVTSVDVKTGKVLKQLVLDGRKKSDTVKPLAIRELAVDPSTNRLFVPGVGMDSSLWIVDGNNMKLEKTLTGLGKMATAMAYDNAAKKLYLANADGEVIVVDTVKDSIEKRIKLNLEGDHLLLNITLDTAGHRAFISDFKQPEVLVVDTQNDKVLHKIAVPESLGVLFNATRNELYVTHRKAGTISVVDAASYQVKKTYKADGMPNSLALSQDGKVLYVSVKKPAPHHQDAKDPDSVMRIAL